MYCLKTKDTELWCQDKIVEARSAHYISSVMDIWSSQPQTSSLDSYKIALRVIFHCFNLFERFTGHNIKQCHQTFTNVLLRWILLLGVCIIVWCSEELTTLHIYAYICVHDVGWIQYTSLDVFHSLWHVSLQLEQTSYCVCFTRKCNFILYTSKCVNWYFFEINRNIS